MFIDSFHLSLVMENFYNYIMVFISMSSNIILTQKSNFLFLKIKVDEINLFSILIIEGARYRNLFLNKKSKQESRRIYFPEEGILTIELMFAIINLHSLYNMNLQEPRIRTIKK